MKAVKNERSCRSPPLNGQKIAKNHLTRIDFKFVPCRDDRRCRLCLHELTTRNAISAQAASCP
jgi:hypothetical protein